MKETIRPMCTRKGIWTDLTLLTIVVGCLVGLALVGLVYGPCYEGSFEPNSLHYELSLPDSSDPSGLSDLSGQSEHSEPGRSPRMTKLLAANPGSPGRPGSPGSQAKKKWQSSGELECRRVLESIFPGYRFPSSRPDFLSNPVTGGRFNLELDCYNEELRLAVEYNGAQHYAYVPHFHSSRAVFQNQMYRDELKRRMCRDHDVTLIEVPFTVETGRIRAFLTARLQ